MKSYQEYLIESKKVYEFKIKLAGETDSKCIENIKLALSRYNVESVSAGTRTPIQESPIDFPEHTNVNVTLFNVTLSYPANSVQVREAVAQRLGLSLSCVRVRNLKEDEEDSINHEHDQLSGEALLGKDYDEKGAQSEIGELQKMSLLKDLNTTKHQLTQYKGVNDQLLANSVPTGEAGPAAKAITASDAKVSMSPLGNKTAKGLK